MPMTRMAVASLGLGLFGAGMLAGVALMRIAGPQTVPDRSHAGSPANPESGTSQPQGREDRGPGEPPGAGRTGEIEVLLSGDFGAATAMLQELRLRNQVDPAIVHGLEEYLRRFLDRGDLAVPIGDVVRLAAAQKSRDADALVVRLVEELWAPGSRDAYLIQALDAVGGGWAGLAPDHPLIATLRVCFERRTESARGILPNAAVAGAIARAGDDAVRSEFVASVLAASDRFADFSVTGLLAYDDSLYAAMDRMTPFEKRRCLVGLSVVHPGIPPKMMRSQMSRNSAAVVRLLRDIEASGDPSEVLNAYVVARRYEEEFGAQPGFRDLLAALERRAVGGD